MGRHMALNLVKAGRDVVVWNRRPGPSEELVAAGAAGAASVAEVAERAGVVITIVSDDAAVRDVVGEGLVPLAPPDTLIIDMSTVSPALSRELAAAGAQRGLRLLDAPVSGGDVGARDGSLSIMVGGAAEDVERARPLFEILGKSVVHCGPAGAGQVVKACNQVLIAVTFAGVAEALVLGSKLGVEPAAIIDALAPGMAGNRVLDVRRRNFLEHDFTAGFRIDLHHKDLEIALASGGEVNASLTLSAVVQQMFRQLRAEGRGGDDSSALLSVVEERSAHRI